MPPPQIFLIGSVQITQVTHFFAKYQANHLAVQSVRQKKQSSIKASRCAKNFLMMEEEGRSQPTRLHWWIEVHMVLIQNPLRAGQDTKEVRC